MRSISFHVSSHYQVKIKSEQIANVIDETCKFLSYIFSPKFQEFKENTRNIRTFKVKFIIQ